MGGAFQTAPRPIERGRVLDKKTSMDQLRLSRFIDGRLDQGFFIGLALIFEPAVEFIFPPLWNHPNPVRQRQEEASHGTTPEKGL